LTEEAAIAVEISTAMAAGDISTCLPLRIFKHMPETGLATMFFGIAVTLGAQLSLPGEVAS
jgi:hypothetical protein